MLLLMATTSLPAAAQAPNRAAQPPLYFQPDAAAARAAATSPLAPQLRQYQAYTLDLAGLRAALAAAPLRSNAAAPALTLGLPMPDGTTRHFRVWEAPLMAPALAARYPALHTYGGQGVENPLAQLSLTVSPRTFAAQVLNADEPRGTAYVQAAAATDAAHYLSYFAQDVLDTPLKGGGCGSGQLEPIFQAPRRRPGGPRGGDDASTLVAPVGPTLTVYRVYITTTQEYSGTLAARPDVTVQAEVVNIINFVRTIQERDLAITISLVGTKFYRAGDTGNYDQTSDFQMLKQNQLNVSGLAAATTYDYAHLFASSGSGLAFTGVVGNNNPNGGGPYENPATSSTTAQVNAPLKAGAVSGSAGRTTPAPDYFATSVVAHEMGHQFSATHTANTGQGACAGNRTAGTAYEPGKGSTIMSYADAGCGTNSIVSRADPYYHTGSLEQIRTYIESIPAVGTGVASGNSAPTVTVPINRIIPRSTPFKLTATGADADGDLLRYTWEELDLGPVADLTTPQVTNDNVPLFRSVLPGTTGATRVFPQLSFLSGSPTSSTSNTERLPTVARTFNLRCTVRDYHAVAGAVAANTASSIVGGVALSRIVALAVSAANASPFAVMAPNTVVTWAANTTQTVTWDGAGTKTSAVNCQTVNVRLSTDGGATYPVMLAAGVPNVDGAGSVSVTTPTFATTTARVMLEAADNYFFDISDVNFTISAAPGGPAISSLSPGSGVAGSTLTISGTGFGTNPAELSVTVGGVAATITGVTNTVLTVAVPTTALTGAVVVTRSNSGAANGTANGGVFQVTPVVLSVSPTSGTVGSSVVISGNSFGGATRVSFNDVETTSFTVNTAVSANTLTVNVPVGATTGPVVVYTAGGASNADVIFTVVPFAVASISPASNATVVREFTFVSATFNAAAGATNSTLVPIKVSSLQAGGRKAGATTVSGNAVSFNQTTDFWAGEVVQVSVTPAALSSAGASPAQGYVSQFTVRSRTRTGLNAGANTAVGTAPRYSAAGDLDGDQDLDLVVSNSNGTTGTTVSVLLNNFNSIANGNNGTGTGFTAAATVTVGAGPQGLVLADLNNDQQLDLLVASNGAGRVSVFQGNGNGTFTTQTPAALSTFSVGLATQVAVGDLNGDGNLDFVVPEQFSNVGYVLIGLGDGNFGFVLSEYTDLANNVRSVALVDLNRDGRLDLVSASATSTNDGTVNLRRGNGDGTFGGAAASGSQDLPALGASYVVAADLTADGYPDVACFRALVAGLQPINIWLGLAAGTVSTSPLTSDANGQAATLTTADYDGDGDLDLFAPQTGSSAGTIAIISYNFGTGVFDRDVSSTGVGTSPYSVVLADFNNDRALDFLTANTAGTLGNNVTLRLAAPAGVPLPVELVSFTAARTGAHAVALAWRTATELRNAGFVVERSPDGLRFDAVSALVPGLGTSGAGQAYHALDDPAPAALLYYRLRQVDEGGSVKYSPVAVVAAWSGDAAPAQLLVYPNPARLAAFVQLTGRRAPGATVRLFDALGRTVRTAPAPAVGTVLELPLRDLPAGLYVVRYGTLSQRLAVE